MRCLVVADIHANLAALEAVLEAAGSFAELWCLGDLVGYGPEPDECIERIRQYEHVAVAGNHDLAALGRLDLDEFNSAARAAAEWTGSRLRPDSRRYLEGLDGTIRRDLYTLVHASVSHPMWEYVDDADVARRNLDLQETPYCLVGHTHVPMLYERQSGRGSSAEATYLGIRDEPLGLVLGGKLILNPGSVGQPRDGDPRAAYMILDPETGEAEMRRVSYSVQVTQRRMAEAGLSQRNATRLAIGR